MYFISSQAQGIFNCYWHKRLNLNCTRAGTLKNADLEATTWGNCHEHFEECYQRGDTYVANHVGVSSEGSRHVGVI